MTQSKLEEGGLNIGGFEMFTKGGSWLVMVHLGICGQNLPLEQKWKEHLPIDILKIGEVKILPDLCLEIDIIASISTQ